MEAYLLFYMQRAPPRIWCFTYARGALTLFVIVHEQSPPLALNLLFSLLVQILILRPRNTTTSSQLLREFGRYVALQYFPPKQS